MKRKKKEEKTLPPPCFFVVGDCFGREWVVCCFRAKGVREVGVGFGRAIGQ